MIGWVLFILDDGSHGSGYTSQEFPNRAACIQAAAMVNRLTVSSQTICTNKQSGKSYRIAIEHGWGRDFSVKVTRIPIFEIEE